MKLLKRIWLIIKETLREYRDDNAYKHGAGLAYFTIFSLPPILIILIYVAGTIFGEAETQDALLTQITEVVGEESGESVRTMIEQATPGDLPWYLKLLGVGTLVFGATGVFFHLQDSLNAMWHVRDPKKKNFLKTLRDRAMSFTMIFIIGFLLLVSLVLETMVVALNHWLEKFLEEGALYTLLISDLVLQLFVVGALITLMFKFLPDAKIRWRDAWIGGMVTAFMFTIGKILIGLYIGNTDVASTYGAAGSLIVILLWVFFSAQILFLGAEFTHVYCRHIGQPITPQSPQTIMDRWRSWKKRRANKGELTDRKGEDPL